MKLTRIEELALYASKMGMKKVGLAFCLGLSDEARTVADVLNKKGPDVQSVCCKVCGIDKDDVGVVKTHGWGAETVLGLLADEWCPDCTILDIGSADRSAGCANRWPSST